MNFSPVPNRTEAEIRALVEISAPNVVKALRTFLIAPRQELRTWDWHKPHIQYPVWVVAESSRYDYGIVFSDYGFGPECPWGLVFSSHTNFDADYCWYPSLEHAYKESRLLEESEENQKATQ